MYLWKTLWKTNAKNPRISRLRDLQGSVARDGSDWLAVALRYFYLTLAWWAKVGLSTQWRWAGDDHGLSEGWVSVVVLVFVPEPG